MLFIFVFLISFILALVPCPFSCLLSLVPCPLSLLPSLLSLDTPRFFRKKKRCVFATQNNYFRMFCLRCVPSVTCLRLLRKIYIANQTVHFHPVRPVPLSPCPLIPLSPCPASPCPAPLLKHTTRRYVQEVHHQ